MKLVLFLVACASSIAASTVTSGSIYAGQFSGINQHFGMTLSGSNSQGQQFSLTHLSGDMIMHLCDICDEGWSIGAMDLQFDKSQQLDAYWPQGMIHFDANAIVPAGTVPVTLTVPASVSLDIRLFRQDCTDAVFCSGGTFTDELFANTNGTATFTMTPFGQRSNGIAEYSMTSVRYDWADTATVTHNPEPASWILVGLGLLTVAYKVRKMAREL